MKRHDRFGPGLDGFTRRGVLSSAIGGAALLGAGQWAAAAGDPVSGGVLRIAFPDAPKTLDPQNVIAFPEIQYATMVFDGLTMLDDQVQPVPGLATRWQAENQAKEWVFDLREGVQFHHGREMIAEDVVATVERAQDQANSLLARGFYGPVASVRAEGKYRVRFVLTRPFSELPVQLAVPLARILPADRLDSQGTAPVGTGPFRFKELQPGSSLMLEKNPTYWMPGRPYLDGVTFVAIRESIAQQAALRGGAVDLLTRIPVEAGLSLRAASGVKVYSATTGDYHAVITQINMPPFDNPKVRLAFKYLLGRQALVDSILFGQGSPGNDTPLPPGNAYLGAMERRDQNLEKARALIAESGVGPIEIDLYTSSERPPAPKMAIAFSEAASRIGVKLNVRDIPYTEYVANVARRKPMYTSQWSANATLYEMLYMKYHSTASYNYSKVEQAPGLDALLETMLGEADFNKRKAIVAEINAKIRESSERIIPYFLNYVGATSERVEGFVPPKFNSFETRHIWLRR